MEALRVTVEIIGDSFFRMNDAGESFPLHLIVHATPRLLRTPRTFSVSVAFVSAIYAGEKNNRQETTWVERQLPRKQIPAQRKVRFTRYGCNNTSNWKLWRAERKEEQRKPSWKPFVNVVNGIETRRKKPVKRLVLPWTVEITRQTVWRNLLQESWRESDGNQVKWVSKSYGSNQLT